MNWNELRREAERRGYVFVRHGKKHDIYINQRGDLISIERHWTQEVRPGLLKTLKKKIGF